MRTKTERALVIRTAVVVLLLGLATFLDYITGPELSAAAFYVFPIGLAGWWRGGMAAAFVAAASVGLNLITEWWPPEQPVLSSLPLTGYALQSVVFAGVAFLSTRLRRQQRELAQQRERLEHLNRQMATEMHAARDIQRLLLPPPLHHPSVEIATFAETARILGGDALDISFSGNRLAVAVADVSGKGSPAALAAAVLLGLLEDCPSRYESPAATLCYLNERLATRLPREMFVTLLYLLLDLDTGALTWSCAGHELPLLLRRTEPAEAAVVDLSPDNRGDLPLSLFADAVYTERRASLIYGDRLFCFTDGLLDLRLETGDRLGLDRLRDLLAQTGQLTCADQAAALSQQATDPGVVIDDDVTFAVIEFRPRV
jgi:serine phosphatase RsbU (regulator of sigma subunit)